MSKTHPSSYVAVTTSVPAGYSLPVKVLKVIEVGRGCPADPVAMIYSVVVFVAVVVSSVVCLPLAISSANACSVVSGTRAYPMAS